jgi:hypothetical protein
MSDNTELPLEAERIFKDTATTAIIDKSRQSSGQVAPKEDPDERLRRELLRIEGP